MTPALEILIAAVCMVASDVIGTVMVQAEAGYRRHLAAICDTLGWWVGITTTLFSLRGLESPHTSVVVATYLGVGVANYYGTWLGVGIGAKIMHREKHAGALSSRIVSRKTGPDGRSHPE